MTYQQKHHRLVSEARLRVLDRIQAELAAANARAGGAERRVVELEARIAELAEALRKLVTAVERYPLQRSMGIDSALIDAKAALSAAPQASTEQGEKPNYCPLCDTIERSGVCSYCKGQLIHWKPKPIQTSPIPQVAQASEGVCVYGQCLNVPMPGSRRCYDHQPQLFPEPVRPKPPEPLPDYITRSELAAALRAGASYASVGSALRAAAHRLEGK